MSYKDAYDDWKNQFKVNMRVYTDEQMFELGYNAREWEVENLENMVSNLMDQVKELEKPKKVKANVKN